MRAAIERLHRHDAAARRLGRADQHVGGVAAIGAARHQPGEARQPARSGIAHHALDRLRRAKSPSGRCRCPPRWCRSKRRSPARPPAAPPPRRRAPPRPAAGRGTAGCRRPAPAPPPPPHRPGIVGRHPHARAAGIEDRKVGRIGDRLADRRVRPGDRHQQRHAVARLILRQRAAVDRGASAAAAAARGGGALGTTLARAEQQRRGDAGRTRASAVAGQAKPLP